MDEEIIATVVIAGNAGGCSCCSEATLEVTDLCSCVQGKRTGDVWDVETALQLVRGSTGLSTKLGMSPASGKKRLLSCWVYVLLLSPMSKWVKHRWLVAIRSNLGVLVVCV